MATVKSKSDRDFRLIAPNKETPSQDFNFKNLDYNKIKIGNTTYKNDVVLNISTAGPQREPRFTREQVDRALQDRDVKTLRAISQHFYNVDGIYSRLCRYMAYLYRYDWMITPQVFDEKLKPEKIVEGWFKSSTLLENSHLKRVFGEIALKVLVRGCYYGYKVQQKTACYLQELPVDYCRSRFTKNGKPIIEFNIKYFQNTFSDIKYRLRVLKIFPKEFQKAYIAYQRGTLVQDFQGDEQGWFPLDADNAVKFNLSNDDAPLFVKIVPALMDLDEAQDLDKQKMLQQILKIIIQKMPIDKNGDLIFDVAEAQALHNNAVKMLSDAIGVDVLTTFADVNVADMSDKGNVSSVDQLEKVERTVYNEAGVSQMQFNSTGNIALEKSIANDEATMSDLLYKFEEYAESLLTPFNKNPKRLMYKVQMLPTTVYNYKELSKTYKDQTMIGFSKLLPQVALGQPQSVVMATAYFENELLNLDELFVPPQMSSTMSGKDDGNNDNAGKKKAKVPDQNQGGRPELPDDQKTEKTIQNIEAGG